MIDLITGATGFFGVNLTERLLAQGNQVRVLIRDLAKKKYFEDFAGVERLEFVEGDILDPVALKKACVGVRFVYHAAAAVSSWSGRRASTYAANIKGAMLVLSACRKAGVQRLVYVSTVDAFGLLPGGQSAHEETPYNYRELGISNPYSDSKYRAHLLAEQAAKMQDLVIVCPGYMIGPRDIQLSSNRMVIAAARIAVPFAPPGGNSFVHVDDVVTLAIAAAERGVRGRSYIAASENLTYQEFFEMVSAELGTSRRFWKFPRAIVILAGMLGSSWGSLSRVEPDIHLNTVRMGNIAHYYVADRARKELNFNPRPVKEAVRDSLAWFRAKGIL